MNRLNVEQGKLLVSQALQIPSPDLVRLKRRLSRTCELLALIGCLLTPMQLSSLSLDDRDLLAAIMEAENV